MHEVIYSGLKIDRPGFDQRQEIVYSRWLVLVGAAAPCRQSSDSYTIILENVKGETTTGL